MCQKLPRRDCSIHKLALLIMQAQRYGETTLTITKATFGVLAASFTK